MKTPTLMVQGTTSDALALLAETEQARIAGFVINRFRGDLALLEPGLDWLTRRTGKPVLGVLPYLHGLHLEAEDALCNNAAAPEGPLRVIVPTLPRISNHTDFDPLRLHPKVAFRYVGPGQPYPALRETHIDRLADACEMHLDLTAIAHLLGIGSRSGRHQA